MNRGADHADPWVSLARASGDVRSAFVRDLALDAEPARLVERAQSELDARTQYWIAFLDLRLDDLKGKGDPPGPRVRRTGLDHVIEVFFGLVLLLVMMVAGGVIVLVLLGVAVAGIATVHVLRRWLGRGGLSFTRALERGCCPGCGYDLSGISDLTIGGVTLRDVGPECCPECGAPWPLLPPPVPARTLRPPTFAGAGEPYPVD